MRFICNFKCRRKFSYKPLKDICGLPKVAVEVAVIEDRPELELAVLEKELELVSKDWVICCGDLGHVNYTYCIRLWYLIVL